MIWLRRIRSGIGQRSRKGVSGVEREIYKRTGVSSTGFRFRFKK